MPWALTHDDTLPNGVALCPNLHRAFDRYLFWVDDDYRIQLTSDFEEHAGGAHGICQFADRQLQLPKNPAWWPRLENFRAQRATAF
ncbi:hypothetical protein GCM10023185_19310 [Hymenobacter saemangeumensis]|uniref:HNH nuclease domain-containing protein n=1 Tax=Hymenobacter saemangeumensis TaxID=1084522 RepID=A0ABP8IC76_9BACT